MPEQSATDTAAAYLSGVDLTGPPPEQALRLGALTGELLELAEARGYRKAITALREGAKSKLIPPEKAAALSEAVGWLETYLEAIAEEGK